MPTGRPLEGGSTTLPSVSTRQATASARPTHVRWVFPEQRATRLVGKLVVGRDDSADVRLAGAEVSRNHAELRVAGPVVSVSDLGSSNGVFVDGVRTKEARLEGGSVVRCGEWVGVLTTVEDGVDPLFFAEIAREVWGGPKLRAALEPARRIGTNVRVVIQGATGTGKEGTARAVHDWSGRSGDFVPVNCAAIPESLADSQLFGHVKGAFTGADRESRGFFRDANRGTLFLDEVLELPRATQPKLLRAMDPGVIRPLGEPSDVKVDARIIVAAQGPLEDAVSAGRFRADLYARLNGLTIALPPLEARREDIVPLFLHFLRRQAGPSVSLDARLVESLCVYDWPTNVRELLTTATLMGQLHSGEAVLRRSHLPAAVGPRTAERSTTSEEIGGDDDGGAPSTRKPTDDPVELQKFAAAMVIHGSVAKAAAELGISRARGYRLQRARPNVSTDDKENE